MTDNEIIKALECCYGLAPCDEVDCALCPFCDYDAHKECTEELAKAILDLIKHQQREIESLQTEKDNLITTYKECMVDIIKVFADKVKAQDGNAFITEWYESADICYEFDNEAYEKFIDNLIQEFVEAKYDR